MTRGRVVALAALADVVAVLVFVVIGRINHDDGLAITGILSTLWPFLAGTAVGWSVGYVVAHVHTDQIGAPHFRPERVVPDGVITWICTVAIGMVLRDQFGQGIAVSFIVVATIVLGLFLLGWRGLRRPATRLVSARPGR
ncbi:MAG: DUF3054 domain-containing protein [Williamsia herbipolensis]|uniref:DUF3054 domain-containing protein n=1 Tax=Williamsia serinedens TaxID=391736 RepID=A0ABT1H1I8_9NOCA|nr:DUF3054 domain-containing protein [Williamsia serinedens]MBE7160513.1 DUF3054 domain-containing protein [Williamsia herbipolensis]MCP2159667.1 Protein of unknown function (DUF3054) [Williamsia serinedens]